MSLEKHDFSDSHEPGTGPVCPHCKAELQDINMTEIKGTFGKRYLYYCPECRSTLGISHRKGFWMG